MNPKKIRVCHISEATTGGVLTHLKDIATYLDHSLYEQTFVLSSIKGANLKGVERFLGCKLYIVDMLNHITPWQDLLSLIKLYRILNEENFDIIHCHSSKAGVLGRIAAKLTKHKVVFYTPHSFAFLSLSKKWKRSMYLVIEMMMAMLTTKIICVSKGEYKQAVKLRLRQSKLDVILNGIDIEHNKDQLKELKKEEWLISRGYNGHEKVIGFVGRLSVQKNPSMLIEACGMEGFEDCVVLIIGGGELQNQLEESVKKLSGNHKFVFMGDTPNARNYLQYFDVFVSTSLWESMPYAILEAIASKIPIVATDIHGVNDIIIHGVTGFLVPSGDSASLSFELRKLLQLPKAESMRIIEQAYELLEREYALTKMITSIETLYETSVGMERQGR